MNLVVGKDTYLLKHEYDDDNDSNNNENGIQSVKAVIMLNKEKVLNAEINAILPFVFTSPTRH